MRQIAKRFLPPPWLVRLQAIDHYYNGEPELSLMKAFCGRDRVALDVGANIGIYTYFMARHARLVVAYEPNPDLAAYVARAVPRARVRQVAVSDRLGRLELRIPRRGGRAAHELASVHQTFENETDVMAVAVSAVTIDDEGHRDVGLIKVDVEQHELSVLKGALRTIADSRPIVMTECTPLLYPDGLLETFAFLRDLDYILYFRFGGRYLPETAFDPMTHIDPAGYDHDVFIGNNIIFLPREDDQTPAFLSAQRPRRSR